ncbi:MAG: type II toxin-antitoxin system Phd/YefM family antitoxin [Gammaproteobacteria bacterium]
MQVVNFSELRKNMKNVMNSCCENHELTIITRQSEPSLVMMSLDDYNIWQKQRVNEIKQAIDTGLAQLDSGAKIPAKESYQRLKNKISIMKKTRS